MWLALAVVAAVAIYTAGWFYASRIVVAEVEAAVTALNGDGRRASCEEPQARGYPFRIGIFCRSVMFEDARRGIAFRARALRSAAQVYQPRRVVGELDGPARLAAPGLDALALDWDALRGSVRLSSPLPQRLSLEAGGLSVRLDEKGEAAPVLARSDSVELHMRPAGDDVDLAGRFANVVVDDSLATGVALPPLSGLVDLSLRGGALPGGLDGSLRGHAATIRTFTVSAPDGAGVTMSGPVAVDEAGLVDAELDVTLREPVALARLLGDMAPQARREIELGLAAMAASPQALKLRIVKSELRLGFLTLGTLPPL